MAQNNMNNNPGTTTNAGGSTTPNAGGSGSGQTIGALGSTDTGTVRTTGTGPRTSETDCQRLGSAETASFNQARSSYQPQPSMERSQVTVTERQTSSRPSSKAVIGSAAAAALVGGAIPFMLAARKSRQSQDFTAQRRGSSESFSDTNASYGQSDLTDDRSSPRGRKR